MTSSRLGLVDFIKMIRDNGVDEAKASDEDVELVAGFRGLPGVRV